MAAKANQVKIKFLENYTVKDEHEKTDKATRYKAGDTYEVSEATAAHFVGKGRAEYAKAASKKA
jgi:hypothetical protein